MKCPHTMKSKIDPAVRAKLEELGQMLCGVRLRATGAGVIVAAIAEIISLIDLVVSTFG